MICGTACNVLVDLDEQTGQTKIYTSEFLKDWYEQEYAKINNEEIKEIISTDYNNMKALANDLVVIKDGDRMGVLNNEFKTVIGTKYLNIEYLEYNKTFIVTSTTLKKGLIDSAGKTIIEPKYDDFSIIKFSPVLYQVKIANKFGVLNESGDIIVDIDYDAIGYSVGNATDKNSALIIPNIQRQGAIVVRKNSKYGLINIVTGEEIIKCELEAIYSKTSGNNEEYYVLWQKEEITLDQYLNIANSNSRNSTNTNNR